MLELKLIENEPEKVERALKKRGKVVGLEELLEVAAKRKEIISSLQEDQQKRNVASKALQGASKDEIESKRGELRALSQSIKEQEQELSQVEEKLQNLLLNIPNIPLEDVPVGTSEADNVELKRVGEKPSFKFTPKDHVQLGELLDIIDKERAAKISGARFTFLKGVGAQLNRALIQYFCDYHVKKGDTELSPPYLVRASAMIGTGQFPKMKEDVFEIREGGSEPLYLIPTAETPLTNYYADEILDESQLPLRLCAYSACFRSEAGAAGKDTTGIIRLHQFEKVEMVRFATREQTKSELEDMVARASDMLTALKLPHRVVALCTGDMGFHSEKTLDLEVYLPGQDAYREISSCSSFGTFQSKRAQIRYRPEDGSGAKAKPEPLITLNGSGLPIGRTIVAILENHQQEDGSVQIPEVLWPYMNGTRVIKPSKA